MRLYDHLLNEKLNLNMPVKVVASDAYTWQSTFEVNGVPFRFVADRDDSQYEDKDEWAITFWDESDPASNYGLGKTEITGQMGMKGALQVFSAVASSFKKFIQQRKPDSFFFTAEEPSRKKLYKKLSQMLQKALPYKLSASTQDGDHIYDFHK